MKLSAASILIALGPTLSIAATATIKQLDAVRLGISTVEILPQILGSYAPQGLLKLSVPTVANVTLGQAFSKPGEPSIFF